MYENISYQTVKIIKLSLAQLSFFSLFNVLCQVGKLTFKNSYTASVTVKLKVIGKVVHKIDIFLLIFVISLIKVLQIHLHHSYMIMIYLAFYNIDRCIIISQRWKDAILPRVITMQLESDD